MKKYIVLYLAAALALQNCRGENDKSLAVIINALPETFSQVLGEPSWRLQWVNGEGFIERAELNGDKYFIGGILDCAATPVIAYPYWKSETVDIPAGIVKPCGAIYPLDLAEDGTLLLSPQGGVEAFFYYELASFANTKRLPQNFDWRRFRELFSGGKLKKEVLADPWSADWKAIAEKTSISGFRASLIAPKDSAVLVVEIPADGPWVGVSPFINSYNWKKGEFAAVETGDTARVYFCPSGTLKCMKKNSVFIKREEKN